MSYLTKNLKELEKYDTQLHSRIQRYLNQKNLSTKFFVCKARNGDLTIKYTAETLEKYVLSSYNPLQEAERWVENQKICSKYIIFGLGLGYHIRRLLIKEGVDKILVVEPSMEIFALALVNVDLEWLFTNDNLILSIEDKPKVLNQKIYRIVTTGLMSNMEIIGFNSYSTLFLDEYYQLEKATNELISTYLVNFNTMKKFSKTWAENYFCNLCYAVKSPKIIDLFKKFSGIPIIIIAAGPSLSKNVHLLKALKGKAVLLCVGTAYKALKPYGIKPDFIVSFDGAPINYQHFQGIVADDIPLLFDAQIYPQIVQKYPGPLIVMNAENVFIGMLESGLNLKFGQIKIGGSVANVSFDIALKFDGNPIIFVGQDLAYTEGKTHAAGTIYEEDRLNDTDSDVVFVDDIYGKKVATTRGWLAFLRWFEDRIDETSDKIIIDATEGGARIKGTVIMTLQEVLDTYCTQKQPIAEIIDSFFNSYIEPDVDFYRKVVDLLNNLALEVEGMEKDSKRAHNLIEELEIHLQHYHLYQKEIKRDLRKLDKIDQKIMDLQDGKTFVQAILQPLFLPIIHGPDSKAQPNETEEEAHSRIIRLSTRLYSGINYIAQILEEMIKKSRKDIEKEIERIEGGV